jgi:hypothetical protein
MTRLWLSMFEFGCDRAPICPTGDASASVSRAPLVRSLPVPRLVKGSKSTSGAKGAPEGRSEAARRLYPSPRLAGVDALGYVATASPRRGGSFSDGAEVLLDSDCYPAEAGKFLSWAPESDGLEPLPKQAIRLRDDVYLSAFGRDNRCGVCRLCRRVGADGALLVGPCPKRPARAVSRGELGGLKSRGWWVAPLFCKKGAHLRDAIPWLATLYPGPFLKACGSGDCWSCGTGSKSRAAKKVRAALVLQVDHLGMVPWLVTVGRRGKRRTVTAEGFERFRSAVSMLDAALRFSGAAGAVWVLEVKVHGDESPWSGGALCCRSPLGGVPGRVASGLGAPLLSGECETADCPVHDCDFTESDGLCTSPGFVQGRDFGPMAPLVPCPLCGGSGRVPPGHLHAHGVVLAPPGFFVSYSWLAALQSARLFDGRVGRVDVRPGRVHGGGSSVFGYVAGYLAKQKERLSMPWFRRLGGRRRTIWTTGALYGASDRRVFVRPTVVRRLAGPFADPTGVDAVVEHRREYLREWAVRPRAAPVAVREWRAAARGQARRLRALGLRTWGGAVYSAAVSRDILSVAL